VRACRLRLLNQNTCGLADSIGEIKTLVGLLIAFAKLTLVRACLLRLLNQITCGPADSIGEIKTLGAC